MPTSEALTKSYSLLFGLGQLTDELIGLHSIVSRHRPKRLRPYIAFTLVELVSGLRWWKPQDQMSLQEALALLRGEEYKAPKMTLLKRSIKFEKWLRSDRSTCKCLAPDVLPTLMLITLGLGIRCSEGGARCRCIRRFPARSRTTGLGIPQIWHDQQFDHCHRWNLPNTRSGILDVGFATWRDWSWFAVRTYRPRDLPGRRGISVQPVRAGCRFLNLVCIRFGHILPLPQGASGELSTHAGSDF